MTAHTQSQIVCAVCRAPLDSRIDVVGGVVTGTTYHHPEHVGGAEADHKPVPVVMADSGGPVNGVCDFCGEPDPLWEYPCTDFQYATVINVDGSDLHYSRGPWAACRFCTTFVEAGDYDGLKERCSTILFGGLPIAHSIAGRITVSRMFDLFSTNRAGPAVRL